MFSKLLGGLSAAAVLFMGTTFCQAQVDVLGSGADIIGVNHDLTNHWTNGDGNFPSGEDPTKLLDGDFGTKYLNFTGAGLDGAGNQVSNPTGFLVTLATGVSVSSFRLGTANDFPSRDPGTITIEGGNFTPGDSSSTIVTYDDDSNYVLLYNGTSGIAVDQARQTYGQTISFAPSATYTSFRVIITDLVRYANNAPTNSQFSEFDLFSTPVPEPTSLGALALGGLLLGRRRRR